MNTLAGIITYSSLLNVRRTLRNMTLVTKFTLTTTFLASIGILPFYNPKTRKFTSSLVCRGAWLLIDLVFFVAVIKEAASTNFGDEEKPYFVGSILTVLIHIVPIYTITHRKHASLQKLLEDSQKLDQKLKVRRVVPELSFVATAVCYLIIIVLQYQTHWLISGFDWWFILFQSIYGYSSFLVSWMTYSILGWIRDRFGLLNSSFNATDSQKIDATTKLYVEICDLTTTFNDIFGWFLLCNFFIDVVSTLLLIMFVTHSGDATALTYAVNGATAAYILLQTIIIASTAESLSNESSTFMANCHKAVTRAECKEVSHKIFLLIQLASTRTPVVTAAGFFNYNHAMLYMFISTVVTYVIVVFQADSQMCA